jgi:hypothetical protein
MRSLGTRGTGDQSSTLAAVWVVADALGESMASYERSSDFGRRRRIAKKPRPVAETSGRGSAASGAPSRTSKLPKAKLRPRENCGLDEALSKIAEVWEGIEAHRRGPPKRTVRSSRR